MKKIIILLILPLIMLCCTPKKEFPYTTEKEKIDLAIGWATEEQEAIDKIDIIHDSLLVLINSKNDKEAIEENEQWKKILFFIKVRKISKLGDKSAIRDIANIKNSSLESDKILQKIDKELEKIGI